MSSPTQAQHIRTIGLTVSDVDRSQAFYIQALGFKRLSEKIVADPEYAQLVDLHQVKIRVVTLGLGDEQIELMQYLDHPGEPIPIDSRSNDLWFQHLAIVVSDLDRAYAHVKPLISESISNEPQTIPASNQAAAGIRSFKFKDPDRHDLELIWFPPDKGKDKWHQHTDRLFLGIDHSAITIADTAQSLQFYCNLLGMQADGGSLNQGKTQANLDGLPEAEVRVTALKPAQDGPGLELLNYLAPKGGRPMPSHWRCCDIAHVQVELVITNLQQVVEQLSASGVQFISSHIVQFGPASPYGQGCMIKDPNGHAILLIEA